MGEIWREVVGFEGLYEVSDLGQVRSLDREVKVGTGYRTVKGKVLALTPQVSGHLCVSLYQDCVRTPQRVHRLVLEAHVRPANPGEICRHLDGDPTNNTVGNLVWGSYSENANDRVRHGNHYRTQQTHCPRMHLLEAPNLVAYEMRKGHRKCRACHRGRSMCIKEGGTSPERMQANSDWQYARILEGN